jgi:hypothetical protein
VVINEVESDPATGPDWVEFYNRGSSTVTLTGWTVLDNTDAGGGRPYTFPPGTTIAAGAYLVVNNLGFGLGDVDSVRLFDNGQQVDAFAWTVVAAGTYSRCPNGTGTLVDRPGTMNAANNCP